VKKLYATLGSGNCFKAQLLMHQLDIPFETQAVDVLSGKTRTPDFLSLNPRGTVPFLQLENGQSIAESNAMLWVLGAGSALMPKDHYAQAKTIEWMIFEQTKLEPHISPARFYTTIVPKHREEMHENILDWLAQGTEGLNALEAHLSQSDFMLGDTYSIADIALFGYTHVADEGGFNLSAFPAVSKWIERVEETPKFISMMDIWVDLLSAGDEQAEANGAT